jgi:hypothetical protein
MLKNLNNKKKEKETDTIYGRKHFKWLFKEENSHDLYILPNLNVGRYVKTKHREKKKDTQYCKNNLYLKQLKRQLDEFVDWVNSWDDQEMSTDILMKLFRTNDDLEEPAMFLKIDIRDKSKSENLFNNDLTNKSMLNFENKKKLYETSKQNKFVQKSKLIDNFESDTPNSYLLKRNNFISLNKMTSQEYEEEDIKNLASFTGVKLFIEYFKAKKSHKSPYSFRYQHENNKKNSKFNDF